MAEEFAITGYNLFIRLYEPNMIKTITKVITSSEIQDSFNTPIEVIPAPGFGKFLNLIGIACQVNFLTTPYDTVGCNTDLYYDVVLSGAITGLTLEQPLQTPFEITEYLSHHFNAFFIPENKPLIFFSKNASPRNGDSSITLYITYNIEEIEV